MGERTFHPAPSCHQYECPAGRWGPDHGPTLATRRWRRWPDPEATPRCGPPRRRGRPLGASADWSARLPPPTGPPGPISEASPRWPAACTADGRRNQLPPTAEMVGGESSGAETGRGDQDEIHHHVVDDVVGQDGPLGGGPRLPSASGIDGDHLSLLRVSEVVGLRGADVDSLH